LKIVAKQRENQGEKGWALNVACGQNIYAFKQCQMSADNKKIWLIRPW